MTLLLPLLAACQDPRDGTFVGNPTMTARLAETPGVPVLDGRLEADRVALLGCDGADDADLGSRAFAFLGAESDEVVRLPAGEWCGVALEVASFTVRLDEGEAEATSVTSGAFALRIATPFRAAGRARLTLRLGDEAWLEAVAAAAEPGENPVDGSDPALDDAFLGGLEEGSTVEDDVPSTAPDGGEGRVDVEAWPESPRGTPTSFGTDCSGGVNYDLAVPIPAGAMAAAGYPEAVGWCEANVTFSADLAARAAWQQDWVTGALYEIDYNGWSQGCDALHCGVLYDPEGTALDRPCTALAWCDAGGTATVTGFLW